ncbi:DegT/DnrJ/EryC1/StrS family aminotransferase [Vibrio lentus]|uniref:Aminotransferase DegT n=1 Tax=Vibrio lentus TaxID=136468 RepID=A0A2N7IAF3_9VIBR|nr:DegT/DnrJ/EryC1/StrS family aminotransferase [Vibrio lentus]PML53338.1 aminotransferase DegT [Vibrio lentus]PMM38481.1 aminotransferase DegT [Vibrio lentus]
MTINLNQPIKSDIKKLTNYLEQVNDKGWYTNFGPLHQQLTERLESYLGVKNLLLVSNGTVALQVAYKTLNITNALTTPFSFVATASSLIWQGIETSFSDIDKDSYNLCPKKAAEAIELNPNINAIVATHVYGNPCDVDGFTRLASKTNVKVIYDAAHAFGINVGKESILNYGDASTLSFHATKVFHTVEGGAIVFRHQSDFERAKRLINFGLDNNGAITEAGINAKLNEYQCAVGLTILDDIERIVSHRRSLFTAYRNNLKDIVEMPEWHSKANVNGAYMPIKLETAEQLIQIEQALREHDIQSRRYFSPSLESVFIEQYVFSNKNSMQFSQTVLCLPLHYYMTINDVIKVTSVIIKIIEG